MRDTELLKSTLTSHNIGAGIHFAGLKAVGESVEKPVDYYANNVQSTISLMQAMQSAQVKTLVFGSNATDYGEPQYLPLGESHPTSAINPYGRSKLYIEEMLNDISKSDSDWRIACLGYFNPVGAHESGPIGESPHGVPSNHMPYIAQVTVAQQKELSVFGHDYPTADGMGVRDYIHVMNLAKGQSVALSFLSQTIGWHAINLGTGRGSRVLDMVQAFEKVSGRQVPYKVVARRAGDVPACYAAPKKASERLNWSARRTLEDTCASTWRFQLHQASCVICA